MSSASSGAHAGAPAGRWPLVGVAVSVSVSVSVAVLGSVPAAHAQGAGPRGEDRLVVTVRDAGAGADGTYELWCRPGGGSHPDPGRACAAVERSTRWGRDAFAPAPGDRVCTLQHGGPATARVTGTWAGRPVDATFDRRDGCAIERWNRLVPLLPEVGYTPRP